MMSEKKVKMLENKVNDYRRFAFITIALTAFLAIGAIVPNEAVQASGHQSGLLITIGVMLVLSIFFHKTSIKTRQILAEEK